MFKLKTVNKISKLGLDLLDKEKFVISDTEENPDAILVRSSKLHDYKFGDKLQAIGRAGAGVNNIPLDRCTEENIVVFNTPGANANAVKEIVLGSLFVAARNMREGEAFCHTLANETNEEINRKVEENKSHYKGFEIRNKRLGVIGLGAIGMMVANDAVALGMEVDGYDPFISVNRAWELSRAVRPCENFTKLLSNSDFITVHVSLTNDTRSLFNEAAFSKMKKGAVLLNFSRAEIVDEDAVLNALSTDKLKLYITDFPSKKLLENPKVLALPHLGASTKEAEDNCAIMIAEQIADFLAHGNIINSVNFPNCALERGEGSRITIANDNVPNMVGQISSVLAAHHLNIIEMINKSRGNIAYNIVDIMGDVTEEIRSQLKNIQGVKFVRVFTPE